MTTLRELELRRPARADARRNYDALIKAARGAFAELGADAPLEEIARRAEVGIATLYRNFPTREVLIESVYLEEVEAVCEAAAEVAGLEPWTALTTWLDRLVDYVGTKRALIDALNRESSALQGCRVGLVQAGGPLLARAQEAGLVRDDIGITEVMQIVSGISGVSFASPDMRKKVLGVALDGLRTRAVG
ncbi:MAG: TetR/AcrR family transcriptional regulator [Alphaproteobacteria bacterium]|nr:MAG: TetR/AcrR family transcriptional regulator [Alphaproteobacteria bacterium]